MDLFIIMGLSTTTWALFLVLAEIGERSKRSNYVQKTLDK